MYVDADLLAAAMEAAGIHAPELEETAAGVEDIAKSYGGLVSAADEASGKLAKINIFKTLSGAAAEKGIQYATDLATSLTTLAEQKQIDIGIVMNDPQQAREYIGNILDLIQSGKISDINMAVDAQGAQETAQALNEAADAKEKLDGETEANVESNAEDAGEQIDNVAKAADDLQSKSPISIAITASGSGAISVIQSVARAAMGLNGYTAKVNVVTETSTKAAAAGTKNAAGGLTLVNEQGAELIQEGDIARIAGGGQPTLTVLRQGATVFNAQETRRILNGRGLQLLTGGINAFAGGTAGRMTRFGVSSSSGGGEESGSSSGGSSSGSSSGGGSGSSSGSDDELTRLQDIVSLLKSELSLLEAQNAPLRQQILKQREIQNAINNQKNYLISIGGSQEEINKLATEWYKINEDIAKLQKKMFDDLDDAIDNEIKQIEKLRDNETKVIDDQIKAIEAERDAKKKQLEYEEKIQAVEEAQANLQKAQTARTVRYYNALTGQWEWGANANDVKSAEEALKEAQDNLADYLEEKQIDDLKAEKEAIEARYEGRIDQWKEVQQILEEKGITIEEALDQIQKNGNRNNAAQLEQIRALNVLLGKLGYHISTTSLPQYDSGGVLSGVGGIKATAQNEMILPPDITSKMISPLASGMLNQRLNELRFLYGTNSAMGIPNSIGSQYNGDMYTFGNITLTTEQAKATTVYDLAMASRNLRSYARAN